MSEKLNGILYRLFTWLTYGMLVAAVCAGLYMPVTDYFNRRAYRKLKAEHDRHYYGYCHAQAETDMCTSYVDVEGHEGACTCVDTKTGKTRK